MTSNTLLNNLTSYRALLCLVILVLSGTPSLQAQHAVDAAFRSPHNGYIYMFRGDEYIRIDSATLNCDPGYPRNISAGWGVTFPVGWESDWDAITPRNNGSSVALIFKGNAFYEWDINTSTFFGPYGYNSFSNLPASFGNVTAAYASPTADGFWLFDEDEYTFINGTSYNSSGTVLIASDYGTLYPENFKHIDAAFAQPHNDFVFYIRGTQESDFQFGTSSTFSLLDVTGRFTNWPFTDAVLPFANGECEVDVQLSDNKCGPLQEIPVLVDNLSFGTNTLGVDTRLASVELHVLHQFDGDVDVSLISPGGVEVELSTDNGSSTADYGTGCLTATIFTMTADTAITGGTAPFVGAYVPEGDFSDFQNGTSAEGKWRLKICDDGGSDFGTLEYIQLNFVAFTPVGVAAQHLNRELKVFPNPSSGIFQVSLPMANGLVTVTDLSGRVLRQVETNAPSLSIDLNDQVAGMYILRFQSADGQQTAYRRLTVAK